MGAVDTTRQVYSLQEAAAILGVGQTTLYKMSKSGQLPTVRLGKRKVVPKIALARMLDVSVPGRDVSPTTPE